MNLNPNDVTVGVWPPKRDGMTVGMPKGVLVMHISGIGVICESERSQHLNRDMALRALSAALEYATKV